MMLANRHRLASVLVALLALVAPMVMTAEPAMASDGDGHRVLDCQDVALQAANGLFVTSEPNYPGDSQGILRARADQIGPWERFSLCTVDDPSVYGAPYALWAYSVNGWVSAEFFYPGTTNGMLRGRPDSIKIDSWEEFFVYRDCVNNSCWAFRSRWNDEFVAAELEPVYPPDHPFYGMLRARSDNRGPWERFNLIRLA